MNNTPPHILILPHSLTGRTLLPYLESVILMSDSKHLASMSYTFNRPFPCERSGGQFHYHGNKVTCQPHDLPVQSTTSLGLHYCTCQLQAMSEYNN